MAAPASFFQDDEILGKAYDAHIVGRLLRFARPHWRLLVVALFSMLLISATDLLGPAITAYAINTYIVPLGAANQAQSVAVREHGVLLMSLLFLGALVLGLILRYVQTYVSAVIGQRVMFDLRAQIFAHLQRQSLAFFDHNPVGRLMTRITNDVDALNDLFTSGAIQLIGNFVTLGGIIIVMLAVNWKLSLITFAVLPPLVWVVSFFQNAMRENFRAVRTRIARINANLAEAIAGMQIIQIFNRQRESLRALNVLNRDYTNMQKRSLFYYALFFPVVTVFSSVATALVIWTGGGSVTQHALDLGTLVLFIQYVSRFFVPIQDLADKYIVLQTAMASSERIFGVLDSPITVSDPAKPVALAVPVRGKVELRDVWFAYNAAGEAEPEWVLRGISFTIQPGESVAVVGATGAGKTSLIGLFSRFYDVQRGAVLVDDQDVRALSQHDLRRHIGAVLQDPFIFSGTIASNIRLHDQSITDERVRQAADYVNAARFIEALPDGYAHEVNERGAGLSVGQKQLLAFARAIAFNPEILLILDEATSSVDTETEALIQDALQKLMRGRTSIIIAHRLSTIRNVDRIIVLHKGRIVEEGHHEDLLARRGYYYRLYELQYAA
jgi:ATP-binding cassette subfamily B multidrug efflux pump